MFGVSATEMREFKAPFFENGVFEACIPDSLQSLFQSEESRNLSDLSDEEQEIVYHFLINIIGQHCVQSLKMDQVTLDKLCALVPRFEENWQKLKDQKVNKQVQKIRIIVGRVGTIVIDCSKQKFVKQFQQQKEITIKSKVSLDDYNSCCNVLHNSLTDWQLLGQESDLSVFERLLPDLAHLCEVIDYDEQQDIDQNLSEIVPISNDQDNKSEEKEKDNHGHSIEFGGNKLLFLPLPYFDLLFGDKTSVVLSAEHGNVYELLKQLNVQNMKHAIWATDAQSICNEVFGSDIKEFVRIFKFSVAVESVPQEIVADELKIDFRILAVFAEEYQDILDQIKSEKLEKEKLDKFLAEMRHLDKPHWFEHLKSTQSLKVLSEISPNLSQKLDILVKEMKNMVNCNVGWNRVLFKHEGNDVEEQDLLLWVKKAFVDRMNVREINGLRQFNLCPNVANEVVFEVIDKLNMQSVTKLGVDQQKDMLKSISNANN